MLDENIPEEDLLLGLIAAKLGFINQSQLYYALQKTDWKGERDFATQLVNQGYISSQTKLNLDRIVKEQINCHDGDKVRSLESLGVHHSTVQELVRMANKNFLSFDQSDDFRNLNGQHPTCSKVELVHRGFVLVAAASLFGVTVISLGAVIVLNNARANAVNERMKAKTLIAEKTELANQKTQLAKAKSELAVEMTKRAAEKSELAQSHKEVVDGIVAAFRSPGPANESDPTRMTAMEVLDRALTDIQMDMSQDENGPTKARLLDAIGRSFLELGNHEQAINAYSMASLIFGIEYGDEHLESIKTMNALGTAYHRAGKYDDAIKNFESAYQLRRKILGPIHEDTETSLGGLVKAYTAAGKIQATIPLFEEALRTKKVLHGERHRKTAIAITNLAIGYRQNGESEKAVKLYEQAYEILKSVLGENHPETLLSLNNLGNGYSLINENEKATVILLKALELRREKLGDKHPDTLTTANNLAANYYHQGKLQDAISMFELVFNGKKASVGDSHTETINALGNYSLALHALGVAYKDSGRLVEARRTLRKTLELQTQSIPVEETMIAETKTSLGILMLGDGKFREALKLLEPAAKTRMDKLGETNPDTMLTRHALAYTFAYAHELSKAEAIGKALVRLENTGFDRSQIQMLVAILSAAKGDHDEAIALLEKIDTANTDFTRPEFEFVNAIVQLINGYSTDGWERLVNTQLPALMNEFRNEQRYRRWLAAWTLELMVEHLTNAGRNDETNKVQDVANKIREKIEELNKVN